ncbi:DUF3219 family protein [Virgibacillus siamensis]|uniref:DUF3219 family protein n=1 Tax=Virgibacillus siamensis TaxID=480071 RepID=UPI0009847AA7|nr:DUF3219 family protein [Virgibacillus siamensis]
MVNEIILNDTPIQVDSYEENPDGFCVEFKVTSEGYHDITTLLYKGMFDIEVPEKGLAFRGNIREYSTSITNLYESGQVGEFRLCLREVKE